ncbi:MAG: hypothetical protein AAGK32_15120 [Actinomycetota bacterium]
MSPWLVVLVVGAVILVVAGIQITARQIQQFPVDTRNPGSLFETTRASRFTRRPAELEQLYAVVTESLSSEAVAATKLRPLLESLRADAPGSVEPPSGDGGRPRRRRGQALWLEGELVDLERRWGIIDDD